jgi:hypothetical protein
MGRMTPRQPLIIINWTYPEMLVWTSRKLIDVLVSLTEEIASKVGQFEIIFIHTTAANPTQHNLHGQNDTQTTIDYHQLDLSRDVGVDEQEVD